MTHGTLQLDTIDRQPRIGVIETGEVPTELDGEFPDYPHMVAGWLGAAWPQAAFEALRVVRGEPLGEPHRYDGYVITGSRHGAYDPLPWIAPLEQHVRAAVGAGTPVFGICFGHQLMAQAFGARVAKSGRGWGVGVQRYALADAGDKAVLVFHQDQVLTVPHGAHVAGGNEFCPIGALAYDGAALSVQCHPEFSAAYVARLLDIRDVVPDDVQRAARESLAVEVDNAAQARWAAAFFRRHLAARKAPPDAGSTA